MGGGDVGGVASGDAGDGVGRIAVGGGAVSVGGGVGVGVGDGMGVDLQPAVKVTIKVVKVTINNLFILLTPLAPTVIMCAVPSVEGRASGNTAVSNGVVSGKSLEAALELAQSFCSPFT